MSDSTLTHADHAHSHPPYQRHHFETMQQQVDATGFAMWLFLLTEIMFFGGMFTAYLIYRNWYYPAFVAASHQLNIFWGSLNTLILISSSFMYHIEPAQAMYIIEELNRPLCLMTF